MTKTKIRRQIRAQRDALLPEARAAASAEIQRRLFEFEPFASAGTVLLYASMPDEVDTHPMIERALAQGKQVGLPVAVVAERRLIFRRVTDPQRELVAVPPFGIPEPVADCPELPLAEAAVVIVPGVAFDRCGHRLGYGAGFYDRFLDLVPMACRIGLALELQLLDELPIGSHDRPVYWIVTERQTLRCCPPPATG